MFNNSEIPVSGYLHFQWLNTEILLKGSKEILTLVLWAHYWANRGVFKKKGIKFYVRPPLVLTTSLLAVSNVFLISESTLVDCSERGDFLGKC